MIIPNIINSEILERDSNGEFTGNLSSGFFLIFQQLISVLQKNLSDEGYLLPKQETSIINQLNTTKSTGALIYDLDTNQAKVNINGTFKIIQVI